MKTKTSPIRNSMKRSPLRRDLPSDLDARHPSIHSSNGPHHSAVAWAPRTISLTHLFSLTVLTLSLVGQFFIAQDAGAQAQYYRLQLKHGGQYLDADHCGSTITLNAGSTWEGGACQLWRLVPAGGRPID